MKIKTSELTGDALNWAVAMCLGWAWKADDKGKIILARPYPQGLKAVVNATGMKTLALKRFQATANWSIAGPIIEREGINLDNYAKNPQWSAWTPAPERESGEAQAYGPTPLIAAMRCYVASQLGDEVDVPEVCLNGK